jgi:hypothetical protein
MEYPLVSLGLLLVVVLFSILFLAGVWKYWRKSTIARISQALAFLALLNVLSGEWASAFGGFVLYGAIWRFAHSKMSYEEKIDYDTFLRRFK